MTGFDVDLMNEVRLSTFSIVNVIKQTKLEVKQEKWISSFCISILK